MNKVFKNIKKYGVRRVLLILLVRGGLRLKTVFYKVILSDNEALLDKSNIVQPAQFVGKGKIDLRGVSIGVWPSPNLFNGVSYFEARSPDSLLEIGSGTFVNNNAVIIVDRTSVTIGRNCLIGPNFFATDSDFHGLNLDNRTNGKYHCKPVIVEDNVFIGEGVRVMKGVRIGFGAVIGAGSLVTKDVIPNTLVAGVPAKKISDINNL